MSINEHVDVSATCKAIKSLLNLMEESEREKQLQIFATIKTLCDGIHRKAKSENAWNAYTSEKMNALLWACGEMAGIRKTQGVMPPSPLASTALDSMESSYLQNKERASKID